MEPEIGAGARRPHTCFSLALQPSRWLLAYLSLVHLLLLAAALVMWADTVFVFVIAVLLLIIHWLYSLWRFAGCCYHTAYPHRVRRIAFNDSGWSLGLADRLIAADLVQATVWPWLVVMNFRCRLSGRRYAVIVLPDSADTECRRKLRVLLRHWPVWSE